MLKIIEIQEFIIVTKYTCILDLDMQDYPEEF